PRSKPDEPDKLTLLYCIPDLLPAYNTPRDQSCNLRKNQFYIALSHHDDVALVFDAGRLMKSEFELAAFVIERLDAPRHGTSIHVYIKDRQKNTESRHIADSFHFYHPTIGRRDDNSWIHRDFPVGIPEKECYKARQQQHQNRYRIKAEEVCKRSSGK